MNTTGCPSGYATDEILFYGNPPGSCDMPIAGYLTWAIILVLAKFVVAVAHAQSWMTREKNIASQSPVHKQRRMLSYYGRQRLPVVPIISWIAFVVFLVNVILVATNVANTTNSIPALFQGLAIFTLRILCLLFLIKFISLGHRIAPRLKNWSKVEGSSSRTVKFDFFLKVSLSITIGMTIAQVILFCILAPAMDTNQLTYVRAGFALQAAFDFLIMFLIARQVNRVKFIIKSTVRANDGVTSAVASNELRGVLWTLTKSQISVVCGAFLSIIAHGFVASGLFAIRWYVMLILFTLEVVVYIAMILGSGSGKKKSSSNNTDDQNKSPQHRAAATSPLQKAESNPQNSDLALNGKVLSHPATTSLAVSSSDATGEERMSHRVAPHEESLLVAYVVLPTAESQ